MGLLILQVTKGTVDEGIHALATRKLRLDAAVLDGITATGDARKSKSGDSATDTVQARPCSTFFTSICCYCYPPRGPLGSMLSLEVSDV